MKKNWLSILFMCAIFFSACVTMTVDTVVDDNEITIEQVNDYLLDVEKSFESYMFVMDTIQNGSSSLEVNLIIPLDVFCDIECSLDLFTQEMILFSVVYKQQGLIWLQKPYYNIETYTIETVFIIQQGMSQEI